MSAILESVEATNYRSWKHLKFRFDKKGSVIVYGATGSGKSSIFSVVYWILYGELPEGASADEVIFEESNPYGNTSGSLRWINGKNSYKVKRYRKHKEWNNKVVFWKNGKKIGAKDSKVDVINKIIVEEVGIDKEAFLNTVLFIQRDTQRFPSLTDTNQKKQIESLTELYVLPNAEDITKERIQKITRSIDLGKERIEQQLIANKLLEKVIKKTEASVKAHTVSSKQELKDLREKLDEAKANRDTYYKEFEEVQETINKLDKAKVENESELQAVKDEIEILQLKLKKIATYPVGTMCDRCGSAITTEGCAQISTQLTNEIEAYKLKIPDLEKKYNEAVAERKLISFKKLKKGGKRAEKRVTQLESYISLIKKEIKTQPIVSEKNATLENTQAEIKKTRKYLKLFKENRRRLKILQEKFGRKGLRARMLPEILLSLAFRTNKFLQVFDNGLEVIYTLEEGRIIQRYRKQSKKRLRSYATLSGGEKQMVDVSTNLALRSIAESALGKDKMFDCVFLDEPLEGLDASLVQKIPKLLEALDKRTVFVISHSEHLKPYFKTQIEVTARKGVSQFV